MPKHNTGIYKITNTANGKCYVGSAVHIKNRLYNHHSLLKKGIHPNCHLQRAWNKNGAEAFTFSKILYCNKDLLLFYEQRAIDSYKANGGIYNLAPNAGNQLGYRFSDESKAKMSKSRQGRIITEATREKLRAALIGKPRPKEVGEKVSRTTTGRKLSEAHRASLMGRKGPMKGKHHSEETKKKISLSNMGKTRSAESVRKTAEANKGHIPWNKGKTGIYSDATRQAISDGHKGLKASEATCKKHSAALKKRWETQEMRQRMLEVHTGSIPWNKDLKLGPRPEEVRQKISESHKGKKLSQDHCRRLSESHKGNIPSHKGRTDFHSEKTKARISEASKGRIMSPETRQKMSEAGKKRWEILRASSK